MYHKAYGFFPLKLFAECKMGSVPLAEKHCSCGQARAASLILCVVWVHGALLLCSPGLSENTAIYLNIRDSSY